MKKSVVWITAVAFLVLVSLVALFLRSGDTIGATAVVRQNGEVLRTIDLSAVKEPYSFAVEGKDGAYNEVSVEPGRICVSAANCPDKVCVRQGWINSATVPVVCLPHELVIEVTGGEEGPDIIVK